MLRVNERNLFSIFLFIVIYDGVIIADFQKIRQKCQVKLLCGDRLEVCRVPVSTCVLVENLNPMTSDDEVAHYFESQQTGGTVLSVQREENHNVLVFFKDPEGK